MADLNLYPHQQTLHNEIVAAWGQDRRVPAELATHPHVNFLKPLPYMKRHALRVKQNPRHPIMVFIGSDAWNFAGQAYIGIVCPLGKDPDQYDWTPLRGHDPVMVLQRGDINPEDRDAVIVALLRAGIAQVMTDEPAVYRGEA
jgi:hypothetical protein